MSKYTQQLLAPIEPNVLYPLPDFQGRSGLGDAGLRTARRNGLRVKYVGGRGYVLGQDFIAYVMEHGSDVKPGGIARDSETS